MKKYNMKTCLLVCTAGLALAVPGLVRADESTAPKAGKDYTGMVTAVDPQARVVEVKGWAMMPAKKFELGDNCTYQMTEKNAGTIGDLRAGEKVRVNYQDVHGVLIATGVTQEPMRFEGMVSAIDLNQHTLTLHRTGYNRKMQLPADCSIVLRDGRSGTLADIKIGDHVTATYEEPKGDTMARQIAETSIEFTGTLTAIDLNDRTVKAQSGFATKKFNLSDDCTIVINGRTDGKLADLKPNDRLKFSYDEVDGVNVVNRIGLAGVPADAVAAAPAEH